jgi:hypothetical protein
MGLPQKFLNKNIVNHLVTQIILTMVVDLVLQEDPDIVVLLEQVGIVVLMVEDLVIVDNRVCLEHTQHQDSQDIVAHWVGLGLQELLVIQDIPVLVLQVIVVR